MTGSSYRTDIAYVPLVSVSDGTDRTDPDKKWKWPSIVITFWIISLMLGGIVYFIDFFELRSFISLKRFSDLSKLPELSQEYNTLNGYLINTPGCRIPEMNPFDPSVNKFIRNPDKIICNEGKPPLFESNLTSIFMIKEYLPFYIKNTTFLSCCYKEFWREQPLQHEADDIIAYEKKCIPLNSSVAHIDKEFIKVVCKDNSDEKVYEDFFAFVPPKRNMEPDNLKTNVLILGLDAVSRINLRRQLPNTHKYLTKELKAVELLGYNKVADNTFPNLIPVLTGMFESELKESCWPSSSSHFDNCSFLWNTFGRNNYLTAFGEDCAWMGMFNYQKNGFIKQPADYVYDSFSRVLESDIGSDKDFNCVQCVGGRENYQVTLNYVKKFVSRMKADAMSYFGFFWVSSLSHDYLNRPALGDRTYYELFRSLKNNGHLDNTILIFMSDHGIRWGDIRQTYQGQMEERLPFVFMVLPKWFKEKYPAAATNLNRNIRRLTTPFDLHETLKDLIDIDNLKNVRNIFNETVNRGFSLFNEIPTTRTCQDAEIASHWCTCQQSVEVMTNDTEVIAAARFAVNNMNSQLEGYAQCATLVLDSILNARVLYYGSEHITDKKSIKDYTITLKTMPGEGIFEVTVRCKESELQVLTTSHSRKRSIEDRWSNFTITGTVSRLNLYGKQSYCITDFHLKLYCYCNSLLIT